MMPCSSLECLRRGGDTGYRRRIFGRASRHRSRPARGRDLPLPSESGVLTRVAPANVGATRKRDGGLQHLFARQAQPDWNVGCGGARGWGREHRRQEAGHAQRYTHTRHQALHRGQAWLDYYSRSGCPDLARRGLLFTGVRGREILRTSPLRSSPKYAKKVVINTAIE